MNPVGKQPPVTGHLEPQRPRSGVDIKGIERQAARMGYQQFYSAATVFTWKPKATTGPRSFGLLFRGILQE